MSQNHVSRTLTHVSRTLNPDGIPTPIRAVLSLSESGEAPNEWEFVALQDSWGISEGMTLTISDPSEIDGWQFNWASDSKLLNELSRFEVVNPNGEGVRRFFVKGYYNNENVTPGGGAVAFETLLPDYDSPNFTLKVISHNENGATIYEPLEGDILILELIPHDLQDLPYTIQF